MSQSTVLTLMQNALFLALELSAPVLLTALVVGLVISLLQAVTQVNEQAVNFVPKIVAVALALILVGPWALQTLLDFVANLYSNLPNYIH